MNFIRQKLSLAEDRQKLVSSRWRVKQPSPEWIDAISDFGQDRLRLTKFGSRKAEILDSDSVSKAWPTETRSILIAPELMNDGLDDESSNHSGGTSPAAKNWQKVEPRHAPQVAYLKVSGDFIRSEATIFTHRNLPIRIKVAGLKGTHVDGVAIIQRSMSRSLSVVASKG